MGLFKNIFGRSSSDLDGKIRAWLESIEKQDELPDEIKAICIGLIEGESSFQIYFIASKQYDESDDDWACNQDFEPQSKYLDSEISTSQDWEIFQTKVAQTIRQIIDKKVSKMLQAVNHVSVGFDSGELVHIK